MSMNTFPEVAGASIPALDRGHMKGKVSKTLHLKSGVHKWESKQEQAIIHKIEMYCSLLF